MYEKGTKGQEMREYVEQVKIESNEAAHRQRDAKQGSQCGKMGEKDICIALWPNAMGELPGASIDWTLDGNQSSAEKSTSY